MPHANVSPPITAFGLAKVIGLGSEGGGMLHHERGYTWHHVWGRAPYPPKPRAYTSDMVLYTRVSAIPGGVGCDMKYRVSHATVLDPPPLLMWRCGSVYWHEFTSVYLHLPQFISV
jgi:hypothetical protein